MSVYSFSNLAILIQLHPKPVLLSLVSSFYPRYHIGGCSEMLGELIYHSNSFKSSNDRRQVADTGSSSSLLNTKCSSICQPCTFLNSSISPYHVCNKRKN